MYPLIPLEVGHSTSWSEQSFTATIKAGNHSRRDSHQGSSDCLHGNMEPEKDAAWEHFKRKRLKAMSTLGYIIILNTFSSKYILCHSLNCRRHQELSDLCWRLKWLHYICHTFLLVAWEPFWENIQTDAAILESSEETAESNSDKASIKVNQEEIAAKCLMPAIYCLHTLQNVYAFGVCYTLPWQHQRAGKLCTSF